MLFSIILRAHCKELSKTKLSKSNKNLESQILWKITTIDKVKIHQAISEHSGRFSRKSYKKFEKFLLQESTLDVSWNA